MDQELVLINFRMRKDMKETFERICRSKNISMTSQLNMLVEQLIQQNVSRLIEQKTRQVQDEPLSFYSTNALDSFFD